MLPVAGVPEGRHKPLGVVWGLGRLGYWTGLSRHTPWEPKHYGAEAELDLLEDLACDFQEAAVFPLTGFSYLMVKQL